MRRGWRPTKLQPAAMASRKNYEFCISDGLKNSFFKGGLTPGEPCFAVHRPHFENQALGAGDLVGYGATVSRAAGERCPQAASGAIANARQIETMASAAAKRVCRIRRSLCRIRRP